MNLKIPSHFETERLILRPYKTGDGRPFFNMIKNDNREHLREILGYITDSNDINKIEQWIQDLALDWVKHNRFVLSYWQKRTNNFLGHIWIEPINWKGPIFEIGWFIENNHQGKGYATEATKKALEVIFICLQADEVIVRVREHGPYNRKSKKVAERCGFIKQGIFHDEIRLEDGTLVSETHYKMSKKDYNREKNK